jgi:hypothetical protein
MSKVDLSDLKKCWKSTIVARTEITVFTGGLISEKYIANLDSQGGGPPGRFKIGGKVAYPVDQLILWLENRSWRDPLDE